MATRSEKMNAASPSAPSRGVHLEDEQQHEGEEEHGAGDEEAEEDGGANGRFP